MAKFISKYGKHTLCMQPSSIQIAPDQTVIKKAAKMIEFNEAGQFSTGDAKEIGFLRKHREFGIVIFEEKVVEAKAPDKNDADDKKE